MGPGAEAGTTAENIAHGAIKSRRHWDGGIYGLICKFCKSEFFENQNIFVLGRPLAAPQRCQNKNIENNPMQSKNRPWFAALFHNETSSRPPRRDP
jgi:hypothetical protein